MLRWTVTAAVPLLFIVSARASPPAAGAGSEGAVPTSVPASGPATRPSVVERVLIISVDGLRPDLLLRCGTPHMHALFESGCYTFWAKTVAEATTLPSHASMLTGVSPRKHGIEWNRDLPLLAPVYPSYPTLFEVAKRAGYTTGIATGKAKFDALAEPGTVDFQAVAPTKINDPDVARKAAEIIRAHRPQVLFVHLPGVDTVGHLKGWGTKEQEAAVEAADEAVGEILRALADAKLTDGTVVILTADHGGAGKNHGPDDPRSRHVPWIIKGPGIRKGVDLTVYPDLEVRTEDTFATACHLLGIPLTRKVDGRPVVEALTGAGELLRDTGGTEAGTGALPGASESSGSSAPDAKGGGR